MNALEWLRQTGSRARQMAFGGQSGINFWTGGREKLDIENLVGDGRKSDIVMACVHWLMDTFPEPPLTLLEVNPDGPAPVPVENEVTDLLATPNQFYDGLLLLSATAVSYILDGNGYIRIIPGQFRQPAELYYVPHHLMRPAWPAHDKYAFITHYVQTVPGFEDENIPVEEVIHFRFGLDPDNPRKGISRLKTVLREAATDLEASNWTGSLLAHGGLPMGLVTPHGRANFVMSETQLESAKEDMTRKLSGPDRGKPIFVHGPLDFKPFSFDPKTMDLKSIRRLSEERIAANIGFPPIVMNLGAGLDHATYSNYDIAERVAYKRLAAIWRSFARTLQNQLLPRFATLNPANFQLAFDLSEVQALQEDQNALATRMGTLFNNGTYTLLESRAGLGAEEIDELVDVRRIPLNVLEVPVGMAPEALLPSQDDDDDEGSDGDEGDDDSGGDSEGEGDSGEQSIPPRVRKWSLRELEMQARIIRTLFKQGDIIKVGFRQDLLEAFDKLGAQAYEAFREVANLNVDRADPSVELLIDEVLDQMRITAFVEEDLFSLYQKHHTVIATTTGEIINSVLDFGLELDDPQFRDVLAKGGRGLGLQDIEADTRTAIRRAIGDGTDSPIDIARRIRTQVPAGRFTDPRYRAELIARTETKYGQNISSLAYYREGDEIVGVIAFDAQQGNTDADCEARNGTIFSFDEADVETDKEHPNGSLSWAPVTGP